MPKFEQAEEHRLDWELRGGVIRLQSKVLLTEQKKQLKKSNLSHTGEPLFVTIR